MKITLIIPDEMHEMLRRIAYEDRVSQSELIRQAITEWFESHNENIKDVCDCLKDKV